MTPEQRDIIRRGRITVSCMAVARKHWERGLVKLRKETVALFTRQLKRQGITPTLGLSLPSAAMDGRDQAAP